MYSKWITIVVCFYSLAFIPIRFSRITFSSKTDAIHYRSSFIDNTIFIDDTPVITDPLFDKTPRITFYNSSESIDLPNCQKLYKIRIVILPFL